MPLGVEMDIQAMLEDVEKVQAQTTVLLVEHDKLSRELWALKQPAPDDSGEMFLILLPGRVKAAQKRLDNCRDQIDFNIAFCEDVINKMVAALDAEGV